MHRLPPKPSTVKEQLCGVYFTPICWSPCSLTSMGMCIAFVRNGGGKPINGIVATLPRSIFSHFFWPRVTTSVRTVPGRPNEHLQDPGTLCYEFSLPLCPVCNCPLYPEDTAGCRYCVLDKDVEAGTAMATEIEAAGA